MNLALFEMGGRWHQVKRNDPRARALADRHYSRQTIGGQEFMASGRTLVMLTEDALAVWGVIENHDGGFQPHWRCSIFRNEGAGLSSTLIVEATHRTYAYWVQHYRRLPTVPLTTEINRDKVRRKRDFGRCFRRAGWVEHGETSKGLLVLRAPAPQGLPQGLPSAGPTYFPAT